MAKQARLQFNNYTVTELIYRNIPIDGERHEFELFPHFQQKLMDRGDNNYDVQLSIQIAPNEENPVPFELKVTIIGHFTYDCSNDDMVSDQMKDCIIHQNTVAILFPFLRAIVASLSTSANIPPLILPIMNFTASDSNNE